MALVDVVSNIISLDNNGIAYANNSNIQKQAEEKLRYYIGNDYDDIYQRSIDVTSVSDYNGTALFYAIDHQLGYCPYTERVTTTTFNVSGYNQTNQYAERFDQNQFRIAKRYRASEADLDKFILFSADDTGTAKTPFYDDYQLAEAYFLASLLIERLKIKRTLDPLYDAKEYGEGHIRPASQDEYRKQQAYFEKQAKDILVRLHYSTIKFV